MPLKVTESPWETVMSWRKSQLWQSPMDNDVYWNKLVMSSIRVRLMSSKGLSQLGLYTLVEQGAFDTAFFTEFVRGIKKNDQRICYTQNNSTAVFTDTWSQSFYRRWESNPRRGTKEPSYDWSLIPLGYRSTYRILLKYLKAEDKSNKCTSLLAGS